MSSGVSATGPTDVRNLLPVFVQDYGAYCDGSHDDTAAFQAAANVACSQGRALHLGTGLAVISSPILLQNAMPSLLGSGEGTTVVVGVHNGPIFTIAADIDLAVFTITNFTLRGQYDAAADYSLTCGFDIQGDGDHWFQFGRFTDLTFEGFYTAFRIEKGTFLSSFGQESRVAYCGFDGINILGGSRPATYGWLWRYGSGTGMTYSNCKCQLNAPGASLLRFEGDGAVVGDIIIVGGHFGGTNAQLISVGPNTVYRCNITVTGSQLDAGMNIPFNLDPNGTTYTRLLLSGNNLGGGVQVSLPPIEHSIIDDQLVSSWRAGTHISTDATGALAFDVFSIKLAPYTGTFVTLQCSGLVGGIAGGIARYTYDIYINGGNVTLVSRSATCVPDTFVSWTTSIAGDTARFTVHCGPTASNTQLDCQITATGGTFAIARL